ncbi:arachidonate 15-lipoxygenase-like [Otolemur garnettii]|uniref:arachidonate 15-lipoxygenase-like n=1 Tax=Otolemur garnettii TaxID=30611 RepID=UPI0006444319|nr:arachidonate 15-lipoxygenase-like [Otolemur garnettii]
MLIGRKERKKTHSSIIHPTPSEWGPGPPAGARSLSLCGSPPLSPKLRGGRREWGRGGGGEEQGCVAALAGRLHRAEPALCLQEAEFKVDVQEYLGPLLFVKLRKRHLLQDDAWYCNWIAVQGPGDSGDEYRFPCYRWVEGNGVLSIPEGTGRTVLDDPQDFFKKYREEELKERRKLYRWGNWKDGLILNMTGATICDLPVDERFLEDKRIDFEASLAKGLADLAIKDSLNVLTCWNDLDDFKRIFWCGQSKLAERVRDSWKEDAIFGYQFLNGANPMLLRRSTHLPERLVFPPGMEELQAQLKKELEVWTSEH